VQLSYFDLEEEGFDFDDEDLVDDFALVCFVGVEVDFLCDEVDTFFVGELLPRTRVPGASFTGSATVMVRPGAIALEER